MTNSLCIIIWISWKFLNALWISIMLHLCKRMSFSSIVVLLCHEVTLMRVLCVYCPWHVKFTTVIARIGISCKLIYKLLLIHILFNTINNVNDIVDIFFKCFTFLKAVHWYHFGLLICYCFKISSFILRRFCMMVSLTMGMAFSRWGWSRMGFFIKALWRCG